jgi:non-heme chloroperoxidase
VKFVLAVLLVFALIDPRADAAAVKDGFVTVADGTRIHYVEAGAGKPIVLVPGWMMPGWIWQDQIDELSKTYRVIAIDPRAQGESDKPDHGYLPEQRAHDYKQVVDHLGLRQPVLVGWSMGCGELLSYVQQFSEDNVGGLVLVDGMLPAKQNPSVLAVLSQWTTQLQQDRKKEADVFVHAMYNKAHPDEYLQRVEQATLKVPTNTAVALIHNMIAVDDFTGAFAHLDRPVLFVYEPALQPSADYLKASLGDRLRLERFDGDGHALFVDDPARFNRVISQFVQGLPSR